MTSSVTCFILLAVAAVKGFAGPLKKLALFAVGSGLAFAASCLTQSSFTANEAVHLQRYDRDDLLAPSSSHRFSYSFESCALGKHFFSSYQVIQVSTLADLLMFLFVVQPELLCCIRNSIALSAIK
jgi:hypothetical protein